MLVKFYTVFEDKYSMSIEQNKKIILQFYQAVDNEDLEQALEQAKQLIAPNVIARGMGSGILNGFDAFIQYGLMMRSAFPDGHHTFEEVIAEQDKVVTRGTFSGTHRGEMFGIAPTGKQVTFSVVHVDRVVNGKVVEHWGQGDTITLMQQLGVVSLPKPGD